MKKKIGWAILILGLSAVPGLSTAYAGALSLAAAVQEGVGSSPTAQKYQSARDQAGWERYSGLSGLLPHVEFKAQHDFSAQYQTVPVTLGDLTAAVPIVFPRTSFAVQANWTLFDGLANVRGYQASLASFHASEQESSRKDFEVRKKIELAFYGALAAQRFKEVADENLKTLQENLAQVKFRLESGVATQYDVLRVEVQLSDATTEVERTQDDVAIARKRLVQAMGLEKDDRSLDGQLPTPALAERVRALSAPDVAQRQDLVAAQFKSQAASLGASAAAGALIPALGLSAQYEKYENTDYPGEAYGGFRDAWSVGVFARWNILDGGASIARSGAARASADRAEHEYREAVLALPADFELWRRRYVYSAHRFESKNRDQERSRESYRISELSYQQGRKTITDVLDAESDLFRARAGVVQSQLDAEQALVELELTIGKDL